MITRSKMLPNTTTTFTISVMIGASVIASIASSNYFSIETGDLTDLNNNLVKVRDACLICVGIVLPMIIDTLWDNFELLLNFSVKKKRFIVINWILLVTLFSPCMYALSMFSEGHMHTIISTIKAMSSLWLVTSLGCGVVLVLKLKDHVTAHTMLLNPRNQALLTLLVGFTSQILGSVGGSVNATTIQWTAVVLLGFTCVQIFIIFIGVMNRASDLSPDEAYAAWYFFTLLCRNIAQLTIDCSPQISSVHFVAYSLYLQAAFIVTATILPRRQFNLKLFISILRAVDDKVSFIRYVSHELRTPLNIIQLSLGFVEKETTNLRPLVGDAAVAPITDAIADINESCDTATSILDDLLTLDKMQGNKLVMERKEVVAIDFVKLSFRQFSTIAQQNNVTFTLQIDDYDEEDPWILNLRVALDRQKFGQVMRNLLSNAFKFTPPGGSVTIRISREFMGNWISSKVRPLTDSHQQQQQQHASQRRQPSALLIDVVDTGAGIAKENLSKLFGQYVQFNASVLQKGKGSGLGLWISKGIVELHGGRLTATSEGENKGCTFSLSIPLGAGSQEDIAMNPHSRSSKQASGKHSGNASRIVSRASSRRNSKIGAIPEAGHGLSHASEANGDGLHWPAALSLSRSSSKRSMVAPVLSDVHCEASFDGSSSDSFLWSHFTEIDSIRVLPQESLTKSHFFIVDDSKPSRKAVHRMLTGNGHTVTQAADGKAFLDMMEANGGRLKEEVHVVLIDNNMPVMNGLEATKLLRASGYNRLVIGLTGDVETEDMQKFISCGADHVLVKPLDLPYLNSLVSVWWSSHGHGLQRSPPADFIHDNGKVAEVQLPAHTPVSSVHEKHPIANLGVASNFSASAKIDCSSASSTDSATLSQAAVAAATTIVTGISAVLAGSSFSAVLKSMNASQDSYESSTAVGAIYAIVGTEDIHKMSLVNALNSVDQVVASFGSIDDLKKLVLESSNKGSQTDAIEARRMDFKSSLRAKQFSILMIVVDVAESQSRDAPLQHLKDFLDEKSLPSKIAVMKGSTSPDASPISSFVAIGNDSVPVLTKPVDVGQLLQLSSTGVASPAPSSVASTPPTPVPLRRGSVSVAVSSSRLPTKKVPGDTRPWPKGGILHFLVVDDSPTNRKVLRRLLVNEGHRTAEASDGVEFLNLMETNVSDSNSLTDTITSGSLSEMTPKQLESLQSVVLSGKSAPPTLGMNTNLSSAYDVILMDHLMPRMNGSEATREIRRRGYKGLIVGLTGHAIASDVEHFMQNGVDHVLFKPLKVKDLKEIVIAHFDANP